MYKKSKLNQNKKIFIHQEKLTKHTLFIKHNNYNHSNSTRKIIKNAERVV